MLPKCKTKLLLLMKLLLTYLDILNNWMVSKDKTTLFFHWFFRCGSKQYYLGNIKSTWKVRFLILVEIKKITFCFCVLNVFDCLATCSGRLLVGFFCRLQEPSWKNYSSWMNASCILNWILFLVLLFINNLVEATSILWSVLFIINYLCEQPI